MTSLLNQTGTKSQPQPWLRSASWDIIYIAAPAFLSSLLALLFRSQLEAVRVLPLWAWVCFVLLIDVAHVYATLFRTYFDHHSFRKHSTLLIAAPIACWAVGVLLYSIDALLFWRVLAYLAVFHFIRQQYGFVALYSRKDSSDILKYRWIDEACIYLSMLYPLMFWHTNLPRNFSWFVDGDFFGSCPAIAAEICSYLYALVAALYVSKELLCYKAVGVFNIPKNLILAGTALSWWVAIVPMDSDLAFTMVNVISHGVPYMALIWLYQSRSESASVGQKCVSTFDLVVKTLMTYAPIFIAFLCLLAYLEEGLWDGLIWREHLSVFRPFAFLPAIQDGSILAILVPLLSLPQSTHYVLDGFIWKVKDRSSDWSA